MSCGPEKSYQYVASEFRCPDGSNPFGGDLRRAAESRLGSRQSPSSEHLVDAYQVPCASGAVVVHVDMYGCPEYEQRLAELTRAGGDVSDRFARGEFEAVLSECQSLTNDSDGGLRAWCAGLVPASLYSLGRDEEALSALAGVCTRMPPASPDNDARASLIALVMLALSEAAQSGRFQSDEARRSQLFSSWLETCQVTEPEVKEAVDRMNEGS